VVGKSCFSTVDSLRIGGDEIVWSEDLKYLGFQFKSGKWGSGYNLFLMCPVYRRLGDKTFGRQTFGRQIFG